MTVYYEQRPDGTWDIWDSEDTCDPISVDTEEEAEEEAEAMADAIEEDDGERPEIERR